MELLDDVLICCRMCNEIIWIRKEDIDFETYDYDHGDNAMGTEVEYTYKEVLNAPNVEIAFRLGYMAQNIQLEHLTSRIVILMAGISIQSRT